MILLDAIHCKNTSGKLPIWMMRQAGRYHQHYQSIRQKYSFKEICYNSEIASEVALAPVTDFNLDAGILFSDILFTLNTLSQNVHFNDNGPYFDFYIQNTDDLKKYQILDVSDILSFQTNAIKKTRLALPSGVAMLGFVGGAGTLFSFASHCSTDMNLFHGFLDIIFEPLLQSMLLQSNAGIDVLCMLDSLLNIKFDFTQKYREFLKNLISEFKKNDRTNTPILFYIKKSNLEQLQFLENIGIACIAIDETMSLQTALDSINICIQGNFYNENLTLPTDECRNSIVKYYQDNSVFLNIKYNNRLINSLSHGILKNSKIDNIRNFISYKLEKY